MSSSLQVDFTEGTFAGEYIRVTEDHYVSVYDIMRVAGVGQSPSHVWNRVKHHIDESEIKMYRFPGRGQRLTPVVTEKAVIKLLFNLPGKRARHFVAGASDFLVRFIGGDESLIERLQTKSTQSNAITSSSPSIEEREEALRRLKAENEVQEKILREQQLDFLRRSQHILGDGKAEALKRQIEKR